jgi:hypothetical protein
MSIPKAFADHKKGTTWDGAEFIITEIEVDFGEEEFSKTFTIVDALSTITSKILCFPSPNSGTNRVGNDWELEIPSLVAVAANGTFDLTVSFNDIVSGKRKIYYQIIN